MATSNAFRKWHAAVLVLGCVVIAGGIGFSLSPRAAAPAVIPAAVTVSLVERRSVPVLVRAAGQVRSLHRVEVRTQVDGLLVELPVKEGQVVRRGDLLARIDDRMIAAALEQAKAQVAVAEAQLARALLDQQLQTDNLATAQVREQQRAQLNQLRADLRARRADVQTRQVQLSHTRIYAPGDGRVGLHAVHEGNYLRAGDAQALFSLVQLHPISVEVELPQRMLASLNRRLLARDEHPMPLRAYANEGGELLGEGALTLIDSRVSGQSGTFKARATVDNRAWRLWPDQSVSVALQVQTLADALVVPQRALRQGVDEVTVWQVAYGRAVPQAVKVLHTDADIAVISGLVAGDMVVTDGHSRLRAGGVVRIVAEGQALTAPVASRRVF